MNQDECLIQAELEELREYKNAAYLGYGEYPAYESKAKRDLRQTDKALEQLANLKQAAAERDALAAQVAQMREALTHVEVLIEHSSGVSGLHLNGDEASWASLRTGGQFKEWLAEFDSALALTPTDAEAQVREWKEKAAYYEQLADLVMVNSQCMEELPALAAWRTAWRHGKDAEFFTNSAKEAGDAGE